MSEDSDIIIMSPKRPVLEPPGEAPPSTKMKMPLANKTAQQARQAHHGRMEKAPLAFKAQENDPSEKNTPPKTLSVPGTAGKGGKLAPIFQPLHPV